MTKIEMPASSELAHVPDLGYLETLLAVARTGSMSAAAGVLRVSQQAVSARIGTAEKMIGVAIFDRSPRGVVLTTSGQAVIAWAERVVDSARAFEDGVRGMRPQLSPMLRVAASNTISECLLPDWASALRRQHPDAVLQSRSGNSEMVLGLVRGGDVELGFVECPRVPGSLRSRTVATDELVVVVAPDHRWAGRGRISGDDLARTALVMREPGSGTRARFAQRFPQHATPAAELSSTAAVRDAVRTLGVPAVLSSLAVRPDVAAGRLVQVSVPEVAMRRTLRAVWSAHQRPQGLGADLLRIAARRSAPLPTR